MNGRHLIHALTHRHQQQLEFGLPDTPPHPLRPCRCDVDPLVFGHTQCDQAPTPGDPYAVGAIRPV